MLSWQNKTWIKIISAVLIIVFLAYDIVWAADFTPLQKKQYSKTEKLRAPMGFAEENPEAAESPLRYRFKEALAAARARIVTAVTEVNVMPLQPPKVGWSKILPGVKYAYFGAMHWRLYQRTSRPEHLTAAIIYYEEAIKEGIWKKIIPLKIQQAIETRNAIYDSYTEDTSGQDIEEVFAERGREAIKNIFEQLDSEIKAFQEAIFRDEPIRLKSVEQFRHINDWVHKLFLIEVEFGDKSLLFYLIYPKKGEMHVILKGPKRIMADTGNIHQEPDIEISSLKGYRDWINEVIKYLQEEFGDPNVFLGKIKKRSAQIFFSISSEHIQLARTANPLISFLALQLPNTSFAFHPAICWIDTDSKERYYGIAGTRFIYLPRSWIRQLTPKKIADIGHEWFHIIWTAWLKKETEIKKRQTDGGILREEDINHLLKMSRLKEFALEEQALLSLRNWLASSAIYRFIFEEEEKNPEEFRNDLAEEIIAQLMEAIFKGDAAIVKPEDEFVIPITQDTVKFLLDEILNGISTDECDKLLNLSHTQFPALFAEIADSKSSNFNELRGKLGRLKEFLIKRGLLNNGEQEYIKQFIEARIKEEKNGEIKSLLNKILHIIRFGHTLAEERSKEKRITIEKVYVSHVEGNFALLDSQLAVTGLLEGTNTDFEATKDPAARYTVEQVVLKNGLRFLQIAPPAGGNTRVIEIKSNCFIIIGLGWNTHRKALKRVLAKHGIDSSNIKEVWFDHLDFDHIAIELVREFFIESGNKIIFRFHPRAKEVMKNRGNRYILNGIPIKGNRLQAGITLATGLISDFDPNQFNLFMSELEKAGCLASFDEREEVFIPELNDSFVRLYSENVEGITISVLGGRADKGLKRIFGIYDSKKKYLGQARHTIADVIILVEIGDEAMVIGGDECRNNPVPENAPEVSLSQAVGRNMDIDNQETRYVTNLIYNALEEGKISAVSGGHGALEINRIPFQLSNLEEGLGWYTLQQIMQKGTSCVVYLKGVITKKEESVTGFFKVTRPTANFEHGYQEAGSIECLEMSSGRSVEIGITHFNTGWQRGSNVGLLNASQMIQLSRLANLHFKILDKAQLTSILQASHVTDGGMARTADQSI